MASKDMSFCVAMSDRRTLLLTEFRKKVYVNIREGSEAEGDQGKGNSKFSFTLTPDDLSNLVSHVPDIQACLQE